MKRTYDVIVIGGGVVGLWTALLAARRGLSVGLIECCAEVGTGTSRRNSGVLHSGINYVPGSLKAKHSVRGRHLAVEFLREQGVPFSICGKYIVPAVTKDIVATEAHEAPATAFDEYEKLEILLKRAEANGVEDVVIRRRDQPFLHTEWVLHVGCTGIVDLSGYIKALERAVRQCGVEIFLNWTCVAGEAGRVSAHNNSVPTAIEEFTAPCIVNSAGLFADEIAMLFGLSGFTVKPNKGSYLQLRVPLPVQTLVYPLPSTHSGFLGFHYTPDMEGNAWVGPNTAWAAGKEDLTPQANKTEFFAGLKQILQNNYVLEDLIESNKMGLRARLYENDVACADFVIREHPVGVCHLLGIESPGLTSAPSLAQDVLTRLGVL